MFIKHIACPNCRKRGADQKGNNLAIYSDGEYCFACETGRKYKKSLVIEIDNKDKKFPYPVMRELPDEWHEYLNIYEVGSYFIEKYFRYCPELKRLTFHAGDYVEARSLYDEPKILSWGNKPVLNFHTWANKGTPIIFVEDIMSAMVIGRIHQCAPLFGCGWIKEWDEYLDKYKYPPIFWLDKDKLNKATEYRDKFLAKGIKSTIIFSSKDPKWYYNFEIKEYIQKAIKKLGLSVNDKVLRWNPITTRMEEVPSNSHRATYWQDHIPDYIMTAFGGATPLIPDDSVIRFNEHDQPMFLHKSADIVNLYNSWPSTAHYEQIPIKNSYIADELTKESIENYSPDPAWYSTEQQLGMKTPQPVLYGLDSGPTTYKWVDSIEVLKQKNKAPAKSTVVKNKPKTTSSF